MLPDLGHFLINIQYKPDVADTLWGVGTEKSMFVRSDHWLFSMESTRRMNSFVIITLNFNNRKKEERNSKQIEDEHRLNTLFGRKSGRFSINIEVGVESVSEAWSLKGNSVNKLLYCELNSPPLEFGIKSSKHILKFISVNKACTVFLKSVEMDTEGAIPIQIVPFLVCRYLYSFLQSRKHLGERHASSSRFHLI